MYPLIDPDGMAIPAWHVMFLLATVIAWMILHHINGKPGMGLNAGLLNRTWVICYIAGYFGARTLDLVVAGPGKGTPFWQAVFIPGGMVFYGGLLGGVLAGLVVFYRAGISPARGLDLGVPPLLAGLVPGRIGCFLNGDDYGLPVPAGETWWTVAFPWDPESLPRYPVQLWEAAFALVLVAGLLLWFVPLRRRLCSGAVGLVGLILYSVWRFFAEFYRGDPRGQLVPGISGLSTSQAISLLLGLAAMVALGTLWWRSRRMAPDLSGSPDGADSPT